MIGDTGQCSVFLPKISLRAVKNYEKSDPKVFWSCPILLDVLTFYQIFYHHLKNQTCFVKTLMHSRTYLHYNFYLQKHLPKFDTTWPCGKDQNNTTKQLNTRRGLKDGQLNSNQIRFYETVKRMSTANSQKLLMAFHPSLACVFEILRKAS